MKAPDTPVQLIVGLGNPGSEYANTRHNAGQDFVEALARSFSESLTPTPKFYGLTGRIVIAGKDIRLLVPTTFMNLSGQAVTAVANFYKIPPEAILVAHDELDLEPGIARLKVGGGHGGHNGLRDIISKLGNSPAFGRLRLGIGHPGNSKQVVGYVLKRAPADDQQKMEEAFQKSLSAIPDVCHGDWGKAMKDLHTNG